MGSEMCIRDRSKWLLDDNFFKMYSDEIFSSINTLTARDGAHLVSESPHFFKFSQNLTKTTEYNCMSYKDRIAGQQSVTSIEPIEDKKIKESNFRLRKNQRDQFVNPQ